jgi:hypothetical protein
MRATTSGIGPTQTSCEVSSHVSCSGQSGLVTLSARCSEAHHLGT